MEGITTWDDVTLRQKFAELAEPFDPKDIEWRVQGKGKNQNGKLKATIVPYIDNRAVMDRFDKVFGAWGWKNEFRETENMYADKPRRGDEEKKYNGIFCGISVLVNGEWVTKWDAANPSDVEALKGNVSDSMKRCAVQWGIGRYLYDLPFYYVEVEGDENYPRIPERSIPRLPEWALPKGFKYGQGTRMAASSSEIAPEGAAATTGTRPAAAELKQAAATTAAAAAPAAANKPAAAPAPAAAAPAPVGSADKTEKARGYKVPAGFPKAGQTLGQVWDDTTDKDHALAKRIIRILAGATEGMNITKTFDPQGDDEKAVRGAATYLLKVLEIGTAADEEKAKAG